MQKDEKDIKAVGIDASVLLKKLKAFKKESKPTPTRKTISKAIPIVNTNSPFALLTDKEITMVLAKRARDTRVRQGKTQADVASGANITSKSTYTNFEQNGTISLENFVKVVRSLGKLEHLEEILKESLADKLSDFESGKSKKKNVRVRVKKSKKEN